MKILLFDDSCDMKGKMTASPENSDDSDGSDDSDDCDMLLWYRCSVVRYTGRTCEALQKGTVSCARQHTLQSEDTYCSLQTHTAD